jgi:hypothetical protein
VPGGYVDYVTGSRWRGAGRRAGEPKRAAYFTEQRMPCSSTSAARAVPIVQAVSVAGFRAARARTGGPGEDKDAIAPVCLSPGMNSFSASPPGATHDRIGEQLIAEATSARPRARTQNPQEIGRGGHF